MHEIAHRARRIFGSLLPLLLTACYTYVPVDLDGVPTGAHIQVHLREGTIRGSEELLAAGIPVRGRESVGGRLVQRDPDWLLLHVPLGVNPTGLSQPSIGQDVAINRSDVLAVETRELNRSRTALAVAAAAGATGGMLYAIMSNAIRPSGPGPIDDLDESRLP